MYGWRFIATDVDPESIDFARKNVASNFLESRITVQQVSPGSYLQPVFAGLPADVTVDFCMCNPPFFATMEEACGNPSKATVGTQSELVTAGACWLE